MRALAVLPLLAGCGFGIFEDHSGGAENLPTLGALTIAVGRVVDPVGRRLFENLGALRVLELVRATPTPSGSIWLTYRMR